MIRALLAAPLARLPSRDRRAWRACATVTDLAEVTARWLTGQIGEQVCYYGPVDVDEDLAPGLTDALIRCNRAGYLTNNSQAGRDGVVDAYGGQCRWRQVAWVAGFVAPRQVGRWHRSCSALQSAGYRTVWWTPDTPPVWVTESERGCQTADSWLPPRDVRRLYRGAGRRARRQVAAAPQLCLFDPVPGANRLWADLSYVLGAQQ